MDTCYYPLKTWSVGLQVHVVMWHLRSWNMYAHIYAVISKCNCFCYYFVGPLFLTSLLPTEYSCYEEITKHKVDISVLTFDNHSLPRAVWSDVTDCPTETAADLQVITTHDAGDHSLLSAGREIFISMFTLLLNTAGSSSCHYQILTVCTQCRENVLHLSSQPIWICQVFVPRSSVVF